jgi:hypothetical protein
MHPMWLCVGPGVGSFCRVRHRRGQCTRHDVVRRLAGYAAECRGRGGQRGALPPPTSRPTST